MEILRIGKHAIKITLNDEEAQEYKVLNAESSDERELKDAFSRLLSKAKELTDFSYAGRKIFTEIFPSQKGGCDIFISCINSEKDISVNKGKLNEPKKDRKIFTIVYFDSFNSLLFSCYRLSEIKHKGNSSVYYDEEKKRYIAVFEDAYIKDLKFAFLLEYGKIAKSSTLDYIKEHYKCIIKGEAVQILSVLV